MAKKMTPEAFREYMKELVGEVMKGETDPLLEAVRKEVHYKPMTDDEAERFAKMADFFRKVARGDVKALSEGTDSAGGYLVPDEFRSEVMRVIGEYGIARRYCRIMPMKRDTMYIPTVSSGVSVAFVDEAGTISESNPTFGQATLTAHKLAAITVISSELLEDADADVVRLLVDMFAEAIAQKEDDALFNGSTTASITGILENTSCTIITMGTANFSDITADYLADLVDSLPENARTGARFYMHRSILNLVRKLKDSNGQYLWQPVAGTQGGTIWGYPVTTSEVMPDTGDSGANKAFVVFGNLRNVILGDRRQMSIKVASEGTVGTVSLLETDQQAIRITERIGFTTPLPSQIAVLKTAAI